jgi:hypothetical protein
VSDQQTSTFSLYEEVRARPVDSDDCWLYAGKMNAYGYGFITNSGSHRPARMSLGNQAMDRSASSCGRLKATQ